MTDKQPPRRAPLKIAVQDAGAGLSPQDAPSVEAEARAEPPARPRRGWGRFWRGLFWGSLGALISAGLALWLYDLAAELMTRNAWMGWAATGLVALLVLALLALSVRELAAIGRLKRIAQIQERAVAAQASGDAQDAKAIGRELEGLYARRRDLAWARSRFWDQLRDRADDAVDGSARLALYEREVMAPLDAAASREVRRAAGRVAAATALLPSAMIDAAATLYFNIRMIRRVSEVYGGRAGALGSLRLARRVVTHAMAAGLIALGDDLLEPLIGGGIASKLSRRAGEGVINGALTARIGAAAMEVCRPLPFEVLSKPKLRDLAWEGLRDLKSSET